MNVEELLVARELRCKEAQHRELTEEAAHHIDVGK